LQIWCGGGHGSDNGPVDEREKERERAVIFLRNYPFLIMEMTILTKAVV
jgi:hypothetical protein